MIKDDYHWTTKDGRKIAVGDMTLEHLRNVLRMLIRTNRITKLGNEDDSSYMIDEFNLYSGCSEFWKD